ncbi:MAG TPA: Xaa-Pro peptidase family protein [Pseudogracilibacillus sp.]|nr:Xaa-Pro peptidase family protein [Pseudogracilibacillus sp.]
MSTVKNIRTYLKEKQLDGLLVTSPHNRRYTTGFTGSSGVVLITEADALLITDFRYIEQAEREASGFDIIKHDASIVEEVKQQVNRMKVERLAFEAEHMTMAQYSDYSEKISCEFISTKGVIEQFRMIKTTEEIAIIKQAAKIADDAFEHILSYIKPGVREIEIANELEYFMRKQGASESSFDTIVASGIRSSLPHGVASEKIIESGELVTLDFGALYKGYCSDITRTVAVGKISDQLAEIYDVVLQAQLRCVKGIKPDMTGKEADDLTRDYITEKGYGDYFGHSTGHGIGLEVHEGPTLAPRSDLVLQENMVVTVEPGIYIPNVGGCRIEDDLVITESGNERLTLSSKELIQL